MKRAAVAVRYTFLAHLSPRNLRSRKMWTKSSIHASQSDGGEVRALRCKLRDACCDTTTCPPPPHHACLPCLLANLPSRLTRHPARSMWLEPAFAVKVYQSTRAPTRLAQAMATPFPHTHTHTLQHAPSWEPCYALGWFLGFCGCRCQVSNSMLLYCMSRSPGLSCLRSGSCSA